MLIIVDVHVYLCDGEVQTVFTDGTYAGSLLHTSLALLKEPSDILLRVFSHTNEALLKLWMPLEPKVI